MKEDFNKLFPSLKGKRIIMPEDDDCVDETSNRFDFCVTHGNEVVLSIKDVQENCIDKERALNIKEAIEVMGNNMPPCESHSKCLDINKESWIGFKKFVLKELGLVPSAKTKETK